ncbi:MAG TPA: 4Fe-4S binding protein [Candidatus Omnitrophota bacterium]|nr:4Fe-4S binding protein [Candidatus Omnitrophota bacterium]
MAVKVDAEKCNGCGKCAEVCPVDAVKIENGKATINEQCVDCETCISVCPHLAISSGAA